MPAALSPMPCQSTTGTDWAAASGSRTDSSKGSMVGESGGNTEDTETRPAYLARAGSVQ